MKNETTTIQRRGQAKSQLPTLGRFKVYSLIFVCLLVVVSGFFFAARQHFSSMDYSMRNSKLRKQLEDLESEKRRLLVAREVSLSPAEIKKASRKIGVDPAAVPQLASVNKDAKAAAPQLASARSTGDAQPSYVVRTSYVTSTAGPAAVGTTKPVTVNVVKKAKPSSASPISHSAE
ncbi:MAG: hypothetical protein ABJA02_04865 [Acidobacteriota bacterium]